MKWFTFIILFFAFLTSNAQNLVSNNSFEEITDCYTPVGWSDHYSNSVDYLNACSGMVPETGRGYQAAQDGDGFAGIYTVVNNGDFYEYREILGTELTSSLEPGETYYISFYTSRADCMNCSSDNLGTLFSTTDRDFSTGTDVPNYAHFSTTEIISDSTNWVKVSGSFVADSAYNYIFIGNFFDYESTEFSMLGEATCWGDIPYCSAYYFIDNVCVSRDSMTCIEPQHIGVEEYVSSSDQLIYPNPFEGELKLNLPNLTNGEIKIFDLKGKLVFQSYFSGADAETFDLSHLERGAYIYQVVDSSGTVNKGKLIKK